MSLPITTASPPVRASSLAEAVARVRWPRNRATAKLEIHREELLRLRLAGDSVESLVGGLRLMGIEIGHETLRRWLQLQLGAKHPGKKRSRRRPTASSQEPKTAVPGPPGEQSGEVITMEARPWGPNDL